MNSSNPQLPQTPQAQPIQDVAPPPADSLGNPENLANIPVHQAPAEQAQPGQASTAQMPAPSAPAQPAQAEDMDKVLKDVNKDVKAEDKPKKAQKQHSNKPILVITMAIIVGLALSAAAYYAYSSAN